MTPFTPALRKVNYYIQANHTIKGLVLRRPAERGESGYDFMRRSTPDGVPFSIVDVDSTAVQGCRGRLSGGRLKLPHSEEPCTLLSVLKAHAAR
jgi:hypothetical protein